MGVAALIVKRFQIGSLPSRQHIVKHLFRREETIVIDLLFSQYLVVIGGSREAGGR